MPSAKIGAAGGRSRDSAVSGDVVGTGRENTTAEAVVFSFVRNASSVPVNARKAEVTGKFVDAVPPVTMALPSWSTTMPSPSSAPVPPRNVEYTGPPMASSLVTKTSVTPAAWPGGLSGEVTPGVVAKSVAATQGTPHVVDPVTSAAPFASTVIALPTSVPRPPRDVEEMRSERGGLGLVTNASRSPPGNGWAAKNEGKSEENVPPVT